MHGYDIVQEYFCCFFTFVALNFGGGVPAIMSSIQCSRAEAEQIVKNYEEGFKGTAEFAKEGSKFVREHGYVLMCKRTGHKMYWWDWKQWKEDEDMYHSDEWSWSDYKKYHKGTYDDVEMRVKTHWKAASKWDRMARNGPTQG
jgi:DNA polymerase I-like protein with 3'-5' exonuclease and polymerase domains